MFGLFTRWKARVVGPGGRACQLHEGHGGAAGGGGVRGQDAAGETSPSDRFFSDRIGAEGAFFGSVGGKYGPNKNLEVKDMDQKDQNKYGTPKWVALGSLKKKWTKTCGAPLGEF